MADKSETVALLRGWLEDKRWLFVVATNDEVESHRFWARVTSVSDERVLLAGVIVLLEFAFDRDCEFGYIDGPEVPAILSEKMEGGIDLCFVMRSNKVCVFLAGERRGR